MKYLCDNQRHLICLPYSIENLHQMAKDLDIHRCWFHSKSAFPHYDIPKRRIVEIQEKCEIISPRDINRIIREHLPKDAPFKI